MGALSSGVKQLRHEFHHCAPSNAKAKNEWSYNSIPIYKFMLCRGAALLSNVGTFIYFLRLKLSSLRNGTLRHSFNIVIIIFNEKNRISKT